MIARPVTTKQDLDAFLDLPHRLYAHDPAWVAPLRSRERWRLDATRNPFFRDAARELFLCERDGVVLGRICAVHDQRRGERGGMLGFFECEDDVAAARALFDAALAWLGQRGVTKVVGPMNLSSMDEFGVVIEGHDRRPPFMTAHTRAYYPALFEAAGFTIERDTLAYERPLVDASGAPLPPPKGLARAAALGERRDDVVIRALDPANWDAEVAKAHEIMNVSFEGMEGFEPVSLSEFRGVAAQLRSIMDPELMLIAEQQGRPVGFAFVFPEMNEVLAPMHGRVFPFGWAKALWAKRHVTTASFKLAGVSPDQRHTGLAARLALEASLAAQRRGYRRMEMSVVNASNQKMRAFIELQGATPYLRFRLYQRGVA